MLLLRRLTATPASQVAAGRGLVWRWNIPARHFYSLALPHTRRLSTQAVQQSRSFATASAASSSSSKSSGSHRRSHRFGALGLGVTTGLVAFSLASRTAFADSKEEEGGNPWKRAVRFWDKQRAPVRDTLLPAQQTDEYGRTRITVVINLEKTLMSSRYTRDRGWVYEKRPCVDQLLIALAQNCQFEVVVFSSESKANVLGMIPSIDTFHNVQHWLFREHMRYQDGNRIKDLSVLGRDLSRVVLVDSNLAAYADHKDSGIFVKPYEEVDKDDVELCKLINFFKLLKREDVDDVRDILRNFDEFQEHLAKVERERISQARQVRKRKGLLW